MNLSDIEQMVKDDLPINQRDIEESATGNMNLYSKYLTLHSQLRLELRKKLNEYNRIKTERYKYFSGKDHKHVFEFTLSPAEIKQFMSGDRELIRAETDLDIVRMKVDLVESTLKSIRDRGFTIKNIIDLRRMEAGY